MTIPRYWREINQRYKGIGSECGNCGKVYFPPREVCPECRRKSIGKMEDKELSGKGEVITFTEIHEPNPEFKMMTPYIMAIVEMEEGVRVTGHLVDANMEDVEPGMEVDVSMRRLGEESPEGLIYYGYKFWPADNHVPDEE